MSNDNDKDQEYQKNMGRRRERYEKRMHCLRMMLRMLLVYAQSSIRDTNMEILQFHVRNCQYWKRPFILMCDT